jgi:hypothetical protein
MRRRAIVWVSILAAVTPLSAQTRECGEPNVAFKVKTEKPIHSIPRAEPDKSLIVVLRQDEGRHGVKRSYNTPFTVDGKYVGVNQGGTYFFTTVTAGQHVLCSAYLDRVPSADLNASKLQITMQPGKTYYLKQSPRVSNWNSGQITLELTKLDEDTAKDMLLRLKLSIVSTPSGELNNGKL